MCIFGAGSAPGDSRVRKGGGCSPGSSWVVTRQRVSHAGTGGLARFGARSRVNWSSSGVRAGSGPSGVGDVEAVGAVDVREGLAAARDGALALVAADGADRVDQASAGSQQSTGVVEQPALQV